MFRGGGYPGVMEISMQGVQLLMKAGAMAALAVTVKLMMEGKAIEALLGASVALQVLKVTMKDIVETGKESVGTTKGSMETMQGAMQRTDDIPMKVLVGLTNSTLIRH